MAAEIMKKMLLKSKKPDDEDTETKVTLKLFNKQLSVKNLEEKKSEP